MRVKWLALFLLPLFALSAARAHAGDKAANAPSVVIRVQSLNALLQNLNLVVRLVGQEQAANQIEGLVKSKIGKQGLEGVDPSRPLGAYLRFGKAIDEINGAILIPMIDPPTFLALLESLNVNVTKDGDIYTHKTNKNFNVYFRFANKYLYLTSVNADSIRDKNLPDPAKALAVSGDATLSMVARIDQIPNDAKLIVLGQLEDAILAAQKKGQANETKVQEEFRIAMLREAHKLAAGLIREADELRVDLDVSDKTKELSFQFSVTGKPGSDLAKTIKNVGNQTSPLAGLVKKDVAFEGAVHVAWSDALNKAFSALIDEVAEKSLEGIQKEQKKQQAELLFKAIAPTAKAGEVQLVTAVLGPKDKHYSFVAALKLKDGDKLGKTIHDLLKDALNDIPADQRDRINLNFESVGTVKILQFELPKDAKLDKTLDAAVGDRNLYLAFRDDALFLALGKEALPALRLAIAKKDSAASQPLVFDFDVARMATLMAQTPEQKDAAGKLFPAGQDGRVRLTLDGGASLNARLTMRLNVLEFLVKMKNEKGQ